jgi:hypothetical protein
MRPDRARSSRSSIRVDHLDASDDLDVATDVATRLRAWALLARIRFRTRAGQGALLEARGREKCRPVRRRLAARAPGALGTGELLGRDAPACARVGPSGSRPSSSSSRFKPGRSTAAARLFRAPTSPAPGRRAPLTSPRPATRRSRRPSGSDPESALKPSAWTAWRLDRQGQPSAQHRVLPLLAKRLGNAKVPRCGARECAEDDSNLHPVIPDPPRPPPRIAWRRGCNLWSSRCSGIR